MARLFTPSESKYYLMALDAGTGSIRAVIFDLEGNQIAVGQAEWRHLAVPDVPGSMEFDLNKNWQLACECMRQALHNAGIAPEYIAAVSACSMREGIVLYNNEGTPIWACANVDARAAREVSELKELHNNTFENEVYRATGQTLALSAIPRLLWLAHHRSDIYRQASTITMISDWLAYMLSGELAVDPSNAGTTGLLDLTTRDWKPALLDMAGLRADILSPVKETGTLLGVVSSQAAELCGLKAGTPVVVGGGDVQLGCLGLGVVRPAQTAVLGGTFWQQVVNQACSELTRRVGKTSTVNLHKSSGLTTKFSRLTLGVLLALSGSASGASLEVDNDQIINIDTDVAYDAYLVGWYGTGVLNILAGGNASLTTITTSVIGGNENSKGTVNVLGGTWRLYDSGNNARPLNVGQSGTGTLNIKQKGHVDGGYLRIGSSTGGVGTVNVEGEDSVLTTELFEIGSYGTGSLNITDKGYVTSSIVAIVGYQANSNGKVVVEKGGEWLIKNNDSSIEFQIGNQGTGEAIIREGGGLRLKIRLSVAMPPVSEP